MSEIHLRQPRFTYSSCAPFIKSKERIQKSKETGDSRYIYQNYVDKTYFQHDVAHRDFKDLVRRTGSDKVFHDKACNIDKIPKHDGYQRAIASMVYKCFDKKTSGNSIKN